MAGSYGSDPGTGGCGVGGSHNLMSLISCPRKIMNSKTSSLAATGLSVGRFSVPNIRTAIEHCQESVSKQRNSQCSIPKSKPTITLLSQAHFLPGKPNQVKFQRVLPLAKARVDSLGLRVKRMPS